MKQDPWKYHLLLKKREHGKVIGEEHSFSTLEQATHKLLTYAIEEADHDHLAQSKHHRHIAKIYNGQLDKVLLTLGVVPTVIEAVPVSKSGLYLSNPDGTILDFEQLLRLDESKFSRIKGYNSAKSNLWLAQYQKEDGIAVTIDRGVLDVYDNLSAAIANRGQFRFTIANTDLHAGQRSHGSTNYYFDNGMAALQGLLQAPHFDWGLKTFITEMERTPLHFGLYGPANKLLAETRLVFPNDPTAHLWPKPGLFLKFEDGLLSFMHQHCPGIELPSDISAEQNSLQIASMSRNGERLMSAGIFDDIKYQINRAMTEASPPPLVGYFLELVHAPTNLAADQVQERHLQRSYQPINTFVEGLEKLRAMPAQLFDQHHASKIRDDHYLLHALFLDDGREVARMFKNPTNSGTLSEGLCLAVNPDELTIQRIHFLSPMLSAMQQTKDFHFLFTRLPKDHSPHVRKHGDAPRPLWPGPDGHRGL